MLKLFSVRQVLLGHLNGTGVVDWRALIVGLLDVPVASQYQLVTAATRLQEGTFCETLVWIDYAFEDPDEALDTKQCLLDAYTPSEQQPIAAIEMLSACAHDPDPLAAFFKACALHQGQLLQEKREKLGQVARTNKVQLEAAVHACQAVTPTEDHSVAPRLQQIWNEVEELALDEEQRRSRNRALVAGTYMAINASSAAVEILRDHDPLIQLAHDYFGKQPLSDLLSSLII
jgi:hypothetical protein